MTRKEGLSRRRQPTDGVLAALRRAARQALSEGLATGTPVYVMEDGKIIDLTKRHRLEKKNSRKSKK